MVSFKLKEYNEKHGVALPSHAMLEFEESEALFATLLRKHGIDVEDKMAGVLFERMVHPVECGNAKERSFSLADIFELLDLRPSRMICCYWFHWGDPTDLIDWEILATHFHEIWLPGRDDLVLFDESMTWLVHIHHSGDVYWHSADEKSAST
jgi:hypothetical protein